MPSPNRPPQRIISIPNDKNTLRENFEPKNRALGQKSFRFISHKTSIVSKRFRLETSRNFASLAPPPFFLLLGIFTETKHEIAGCDED